MNQIKYGQLSDTLILICADLIQNPDKTLIINICYVLPIANDYRSNSKSWQNYNNKYIICTT